MTLYLGFDTSKLYRPDLHVSEFQGQGRSIARNVTRANPLLLMLRLTLELALRDALRTHQGRPTSEALDAVTWIVARTDWTRRRGPIPPEEIRGEIIFSFEWCCSLLDLSAQEIRQRGIRRLSGMNHRSDVWLPGLPGIRAHWAEAKREYEARMARAQQPLEQRKEATAASL